MELFEEKISKAKGEERIFQINSVIDKKRTKDIDEIKIYNKNIYIYLTNNSIKVYNSDTFKELSNLKIPINRPRESPYKEHISLEILENGIVIILADKKLYFYEMNIKDNCLKFLHYLSEVNHFCCFQKKKEIFLLTEIVEDYIGMAKSDLFGNIIFRNTSNQPQIFYEYKPPQEVSSEVIYDDFCVRTPIHFSKFYSFNNDKYLINICGYTDNYNYRDEEYTIRIYNSDNLKEIFNKDYYVDLRYVKITDIYFKKCYDDLSIFYYNEKENSINFINNITNRIYKYFNIQKSKVEVEQEEGDICKEKYFNLKDDIFCLFDGCFLFIIDLFSKNIIKKIEMKTNDNFEIKSLCLFERNGQNYLFISTDIYNELKHKFNYKFISGIIL